MTKAPQPVIWVGKITSCQLCNGSYGGTMYDAHVPLYNQWANICQGCFDEHGCSTGLGKGQGYRRTEDGKWEMYIG